MAWLSSFRSIGSIFSGNRPKERGREGREKGYPAPSPQLPVSPIAEAVRHATVMACVSAIAKGIGQIEFTAPYDSPNGAVPRLLKKPNAYQNQYTFLHGIAHDTKLYANSISRAYQGPSGRTMFIVPENPDPSHIQIAPDTLGNPLYTFLESGETVPGSKILHIRDGGGHEVWATPILTSIGARAKSLEYADALISTVFSKGLRSQYVLKSDGNPRKEDRDQAIIDIHKQYGPEGNKTGDPIFLPHGMTIERLLGITPADADLRELRQDLIREIAAAFGVPPFLAGGEADTKYSNYTAQVMAMYRDVIYPLAINIAQSLSTLLGTEIVANTEAFIRGDLKTQTETAALAVSAGLYTPDMALQEILGKPPMNIEGSNRLRPSNGPLPPSDRRGETPTDDGSTDAGLENE